MPTKVIEMRMLPIYAVVVLLVACACEFSEAQSPSFQIVNPSASQDSDHANDLKQTKLLRSNYFARAGERRELAETVVTAVSSVPTVHRQSTQLQRLPTPSSIIAIQPSVQMPTEPPVRLASKVAVTKQISGTDVYDAASVDSSLHSAGTCDTGVYHVGEFVDPALRRHLMFGVDRDSCCDEWAGFSNCGGLKANPGHLGLKWLRGGEACETTESCRRKRDCDCQQCN
jgi:hypothetical protein